MGVPIIIIVVAAAAVATAAVPTIRNILTRCSWGRKMKVQEFIGDVLSISILMMLLFRIATHDERKISITESSSTVGIEIKILCRIVKIENK